MERRQKSGERQFHARSQETTAQFLGIALWETVHVVENTANKVAVFWVDFKSPEA